MTQDLIVWTIVIATVALVIYNVVKSLTPGKKSGCGGCTGCDMSAKNKGCCSTPPNQHSGKNQFTNLTVIR